MIYLLLFQNWNSSHFVKMNFHNFKLSDGGHKKTKGKTGILKGGEIAPEILQKQITVNIQKVLVLT